MRICLWQETHPTVKGGADTWLHDTAYALAMRGHEVNVFNGREIDAVLAQYPADVVIMGTLHVFVGLQCAQWLAEQDIPALWMLHDYWPFCRSRMLMLDHNHTDQSCEAVEGVCGNSDGWAVGPAVAELVNRFYVVTGNEGAATIMRRNGLRIDAVVEEGIDTKLFKPGTGERDKPSIIYASAAGDDLWKGFHILREALEGTDFELRLLTGLSRREVAAQLRQAAIYVFPSVYQEIWGLALTEAMASGVACIASDVAGAKAQIHPGTGLLVQAGKPNVLREAILILARDRRLRELYGQMASAHVQQDHSLEAIGARWEAACEAAIQRRKL